ncbi:MAG: hypothetical protein U0237_18665 [Thermoleophilia bacterium]
MGEVLDGGTAADEARHGGPQDARDREHARAVTAARGGEHLRHPGLPDAQREAGERQRQHAPHPGAGGAQALAGPEQGLVDGVRRGAELAGDLPRTDARLLHHDRAALPRRQGRDLLQRPLGRVAPLEHVSGCGAVRRERDDLGVRDVDGAAAFVEGEVADDPEHPRPRLAGRASLGALLGQAQVGLLHHVLR